MSAALAQPITRTVVVQVAQPSAKGVQVGLAVQPTEGTPAGLVTLQLSTEEWNRIAALQGPSGAAGFGVSLSIVIE